MEAEIEGPGVLSSIKLTLHPPMLLLVTGEPGSGKTLLLETLAGIKRPRRGGVTVNGVPVEEARSRGWTLYVPENPLTGLDPGLRLGELPSLIGGDEGEARALIEQAGLSSYMDKRLHEAPMSVARFYAYAAAASARPRLLLLDTLLEGLGGRPGRVAAEHMRMISRTSIVVASARRPRLYSRLATHVLVLRNGRGRVSPATRLRARDAVVEVAVGTSDPRVVVERLGGLIRGLWVRRGTILVYAEPRRMQGLITALREMAWSGLIKGYRVTGVVIQDN